MYNDKNKIYDRQKKDRRIGSDLAFIPDRKQPVYHEEYRSVPLLRAGRDAQIQTAI